MYLPYQSFKKVIKKWIAPLNEEHFTFQLQYKYPGTFANRKYEQLSYPQNPKMCHPILVTLLKMQPHYSQCSHENATLSSGTSPLASYTEVQHPPPPPPPQIYYLFWISAERKYFLSILSVKCPGQMSFCGSSLRGRCSKGKGKGIRARDHAPLAFLSRLKLLFPKLPFPSLSNACHAGYCGSG